LMCPGGGADDDSERWRLKALLIGTRRVCRSAGTAQPHPHTRRDFYHHTQLPLLAVFANSKLLGGHQITAAATAKCALTRYSCGSLSRWRHAGLRGRRGRQVLAAPRVAPVSAAAPAAALRTNAELLPKAFDWYIENYP
jgi:hypothetical protein